MADLGVVVAIGIITCAVVVICWPQPGCDTSGPAKHIPAVLLCINAAVLDIVTTLITFTT